MARFVRGLALTLCLGAAVAAQDRPTTAPTTDAVRGPGRTAGRDVTVEVAVLEFADVEAAPVEDEAETPERTLARVRAMEKAGEADAAGRVRLRTVEGVTATAQSGESVAVAGGAAFGPSNVGFGGSRRATSYIRQDFGTLVSVTPVVEEGGAILLELVVERTRLATPPDKPDRDADQAESSEEEPPQVEKLVSRSTLRVTDGRTALADARESNSGGRSSLLAILVTARASK